ncbi:hypothetical protein D3C78_1774640 [compost metagenome]
MRTKRKKLAHAHIDQADGANPRRVGHNDVDTRRYQPDGGKRQQGQHGQGIRDDKRPYAGHAARLERQQQR